MSELSKWYLTNKLSDGLINRRMETYRRYFTTNDSVTEVGMMPSGVMTSALLFGTPKSFTGYAAELYPYIMKELPKHTGSGIELHINVGDERIEIDECNFAVFNMDHLVHFSLDVVLKNAERADSSLLICTDGPGNAMMLEAVQELKVLGYDISDRVWDCHEDQLLWSVIIV